MRVIGTTIGSRLVPSVGAIVNRSEYVPTNSEVLFTATRTTNVVRPSLGVTVSQGVDGAAIENGITCPLAAAATDIVWTAVDAPVPFTKVNASPAGATLIAGAPHKVIVTKNKPSIRTTFYRRQTGKAGDQLILKLFGEYRVPVRWGKLAAHILQPFPQVPTRDLPGTRLDINVTTEPVKIKRQSIEERFPSILTK